MTASFWGLTTPFTKPGEEPSPFGFTTTWFWWRKPSFKQYEKQAIFGSQFGNQIHISLKHVKTKWRHPFGAWPHHSPNREKSHSMHLRIPSKGWLAFGWISIYIFSNTWVCYWYAMSFFDILIGICDQTSPHLKIHSQLQDSAKPHRYWLQALHLQSIGAAGLPTCWGGAVLDRY